MGTSQVIDTAMNFHYELGGVCKSLTRNFCRGCRIDIAAIDAGFFFFGVGDINNNNNAVNVAIYTQLFPLLHKRTI